MYSRTNSPGGEDYSCLSNEDDSDASSSSNDHREKPDEEDGRRGGILIVKPRMPFERDVPPLDKKQLVYISMILAGVGFLLPYNSFIVAVDYYQGKFGGTIVFDLSLTYILTSFGAVILNNMLVESLSVHFRITLGYAISFITLFFVALFDIWIEAFSKHNSYKITLIAVSFIAIGCTVQQSSFYGYSSMLPKRYTQAVMIGESTAGFLLSVNRILTKDLIQDVKLNTLLFFGVSLSIVGLCWILHRRVRESDFVNYYIHSKRMTSDPEPNALTNTSTIILEPKEPRSNYESSSIPAIVGPEELTDGECLIPPEFGESCQLHGRNYRVEDVIVTVKGTSSSFGIKAVKSWKSFKGGIISRWSISKRIWTYMVAIALNYFVTLLLFPGIESEIVSCKLGSWMPVILMAVFNLTDLVGKITASLPYAWSGAELLLMSMARIILVPLMIMSAAPRHDPLLKGEGWAVLISAVLGVTNGIFGSVPMILAPGRVSEGLRELVGNLMTLSYSLGLTGGSTLAYFLDDLMGPPLLRPCYYQRIATRRFTTIPLFLNHSFNEASSVSTAMTKLPNFATSALVVNVTNNGTFDSAMSLTKSLLGVAILSTVSTRTFSNLSMDDDGFISPALHNLTIPVS